MGDQPLVNGEVSNFDKWRYYLKDTGSPQSFIDFAFYYLIAASLQRRVWFPPAHKPLFANNYTVLCAPPGVGKNMVINPVTEMLRYWKIVPANERKHTAEGEPKTEDKELSDAAADRNYQLAKEEQDGYGFRHGDSKKKESFEKPDLITVAPDATTYEALIQSLAKATRYTDYTEFNEKLGKKIGRLYRHASLCFSLEEISSILAKNKENIGKLLLNTYDCGEYRYKTKTQGQDEVKNCCMSFLAGTTPSSLEEVMTDKIIGDGFSSRCWFVVEQKAKDTPFFLPELDSLQKAYKEYLIQHVKKLTTLYGQVEIGPGVRDFLEDWWARNKDIRVNHSSKLEAYYSRRKVHIIKLAMAIHFGETTDMVIQIPEFQRAIEAFQYIEQKMHLAMIFDAKNPLHIASKKLMRFLKGLPNKRANFNQLLAELFPELPKGKPDLEELLVYLLSTDKLVDVKVDNERLKTQITYYQLKEGNEAGF